MIEIYDDTNDASILLFSLNAKEEKSINKDIPKRIRRLIYCIADLKWFKFYFCGNFDREFEHFLAKLYF